MYLRNAPPTPANYAQRAGRGGRSGQAALVLTYCAAQSPHDQYYFSRRRELVSGIVRAPAIDLVNDELLSAHVHAEWLAAAGKPLDKAIPVNLDMEAAGRPVISAVAAGFETATRDTAGQMRAVAIVRSGLGENDLREIGDPVEFVQRVWTSASANFDKAINRWRTLYDSAHADRQEASRLGDRTGLSKTERDAARQRYIAADRQVGLLQSGTSSASSDFYAYRYLATEGFLPGYNFPRLPLYAFVEADRGSAVLQRPRFLALAEFGPNSLVYHEGKAYRCHRAKLTAGTRDEAGHLATDDLRCCQTCGAAHREKTDERCRVCGDTLTSEGDLMQLYRIENVDAVPGARITANDEDRQRRGFELRTLFEWDNVRSKQLDLAEGGAPIAYVQYGPQTKLSRVNLGLRRRKQQSIHGFQIDTVSGRWLKDEGQGDEEGEDPHRARVQRIVPLVEDVKNALLLQFGRGITLDKGQMATLQHALIRAMETEHVLETGELLGEPMPTRDVRNAILFYEASEGGAGVLKRMLDSSERWRILAAEALRLMHYESKDGDLRSVEGACVKGCYQCLLSYYNQPDHDLIDRTDSEVIALLDRMSRCERSPPVEPRETAAASEREPEQSWIDAVKSWQLPEAVVRGSGPLATLEWAGCMVTAHTGSASDELVDRCHANGHLLVELDRTPPAVPPPHLLAALGIPSDSER